MRVLVIFINLIITCFCYSQENKQSAFVINYNYQIPSNFFLENFGDNPAIGALFFIEKENNLFFGIEGVYLFGNNIKNQENIFNNITNEDNALIASDGYYANVNLSRSGTSTNIFIGYAIHPDIKSLSGFYTSFGLGYIQQKILIDTKNENIPQMNEEYKIGYDKAHHGLFGKLMLNYNYYRKKGGIQITTGINYSIAQVQYSNTYLFNEMRNDKEQYIGSEIGFNIGLIIPIERINQEEFHYY